MRLRETDGQQMIHDFGIVRKHSMGSDLPKLYLCAGLQCSGSTLISWCFLQRHDMDGVLDGEYDLLPRIAPNLGKPLTWCKTTISSFRLCELTRHYQDEGWEVYPLLIVRDVRDTWASLIAKPYGVNGFTAEDPPLRLRFRRFREDWERFRELSWPILRYEGLLADHENVLRETCRQLALSWDDSMLRWTKRAGEIADASRGSDSFRQTQGRDLAETLARYSAKERKQIFIGGGDLAWLESEFQAFNAENGYPLHATECSDANDESSAQICSFQDLRRYRWELQRKPIRWLLNSLGVPDNSLDGRFMKKAG
jgi:hypothetical protein